MPEDAISGGDLQDAESILRMLDWETREGPFSIRQMHSYNVASHEELRKQVYASIGKSLKRVVGEPNDYTPRLSE